MHNIGAVSSGLNVTGSLNGAGLVSPTCCNYRRDCSLDSDPPPGGGSCDPGCVSTTFTVNTGYNGIAGTPYAIGAKDEYWHLLTDPNGGSVPRCPTAIAKNVSWGNPGANSQWIASTPTWANNVNGSYIYERCFCVCEAGTLTIDLWVMADDAGNVTFDNVPIGSIPSCSS